MSQIHKHLIVSGTLRTPPSNTTYVEDWFCRMVAAVDMNILIPPKIVYSTNPGNEGLTGIVCIDTSHSAIHIWNEKEVPFFKFDLYSCKEFDINVVLELLKEFDPYYMYYSVIDRTNSIEHVDSGFQQVISIVELLPEDMRENYNSAKRNKDPYSKKPIEQKRAICEYNKLYRIYSYTDRKRQKKSKDNHSATLSVIRSRSVKKNLEFDLTEDWYENELKNAQIKWPKLQTHVNSRSFWRANVDRINPNKGYIQSNCRIIPEALNTAKSNYDTQQLFDLFKLLQNEILSDKID